MREIWVCIEILYFSKFDQTYLPTFLLKKVLRPNHLSQSFEILHEKTLDHMLLDDKKQILSI